MENSYYQPHTNYNQNNSCNGTNNHGIIKKFQEEGGMYNEIGQIERDLNQTNFSYNLPK